MGVLESTLYYFEINDGTNTPAVGYTNAGSCLVGLDFAIGILRKSDSYDPISGGTDRDAWGISAGAVVGTVDSAGNATNSIARNITRNGAPSYTNVVDGGLPSYSDGFISVFLNNGSDILRIDQVYSLAADNVLKIAVSITNVSGSDQAVKYRRLVDFDITPTQFKENVELDAFVGKVSAASTLGLINVSLSTPVTESTNPLVAYTYPASSAGTSEGPWDYGVAVDLDFGTLTANSTVTFDLYYGASTVGQTVAQLRAQVTALGANWLGSAVNSNHGGATPDTNSAVLGVFTSGVVSSSSASSAASSASSATSSAAPSPPPVEYANVVIFPDCPCCIGSSASSLSGSESSGSSAESSGSSESESESSSESEESSSSRPSRPSIPSIIVPTELDSSSSSSSSGGVFTECCPGVSIPDILYITVTNRLGVYICYPSAPIPAYRTGPFVWQTDPILSCPGSNRLSIGCFFDPVTGRYRWQMAGFAYGGSAKYADDALSSCDPFELVFYGSVTTPAGSATFTVTM